MEHMKRFAFLFILLFAGLTINGQSQSTMKTPSAPLVGPLKDTLFILRSNLGVFTPSERAMAIRMRLDRLYEGLEFTPEDLTVVASENTHDIFYQDVALMSVTQQDAAMEGKDQAVLANLYLESIKNSVMSTRDHRSSWLVLFRIGMVLLVIGIAWFVIWLLGKGYERLYRYIAEKREKWLKDLSFKDYTFLTAD